MIDIEAFFHADAIVTRTRALIQNCQHRLAARQGGSMKIHADRGTPPAREGFSGACKMGRKCKIGIKDALSSASDVAAHANVPAGASSLSRSMRLRLNARWRAWAISNRFAATIPPKFRARWPHCSRAYSIASRVTPQANET